MQTSVSQMTPQPLLPFSDYRVDAKPAHMRNVVKVLLSGNVLRFADFEVHAAHCRSQKY